MDDEEKWISAIVKRHSRKSADALVSKYYDDIFYYTWRQIGHREDALDLTQTIFISMLQSLPHYDERSDSGLPQTIWCRKVLYRGDAITTDSALPIFTFTLSCLGQYCSLF